MQQLCDAQPHNQSFLIDSDSIDHFGYSTGKRYLFSKITASKTQKQKLAGVFDDLVHIDTFHHLVGDWNGSSTHIMFSCPSVEIDRLGGDNLLFIHLTSVAVTKEFRLVVAWQISSSKEYDNWKKILELCGKPISMSVFVLNVTIQAETKI
jgi:hypothetical protein